MLHLLHPHPSPTYLFTPLCVALMIFCAISEKLLKQVDIFPYLKQVQWHHKEVMWPGIHHLRAIAT